MKQVGRSPSTPWKASSTRLEVVAAEIRHERVQRFVVALVEQAAHARCVADVATQALAPAGAALVDQRRVERVGAGLDPRAQRLAAGLGEGGLELPAPLEGDDVPSHGGEEAVEALEETVFDEGVEALAVVVDHPPHVAHVVLPAFEEALVDVAFVELGVAGHGDHAARRRVVAGAARAAAGSPAPARRSSSWRRRDPRSRWRSPRRRRPWCARDRTGRRRSRGSAPGCSRDWRPNRYWMAWNTGLACGFTATRSCGRSTSK